MTKLLQFSLLLTLVVCEITWARPTTQIIVINDHEWEVPNEPGWDEVVQEADEVRQRLITCIIAAECRKVIEDMRAVFTRHKVSRDYFQSNENDPQMYDMIFKWG